MHRQGNRAATSLCVRGLLHLHGLLLHLEHLMLLLQLPRCCREIRRGSCTGATRGDGGWGRGRGGHRRTERWRRRAATSRRAESESCLQIVGGRTGTVATDTAGADADAAQVLHRAEDPASAE